jgi:predicted nucleic acid-binding protein
MAHYADTSFLASYYLPDTNSARALAAVQPLAAPFVFTALHRLELRNALALAVFRRRITSQQAQKVWQDVTTDFRAGLLTASSLNWYAVFRAAAVLSVQHTATTGCRSLDVLHLAAASKLGVSEIFSFDPRQRALAGLLGINAQP